MTDFEATLTLEDLAQRRIAKRGERARESQRRRALVLEPDSKRSRPYLSFRGSLSLRCSHKYKSYCPFHLTHERPLPPGETPASFYGKTRGGRQIATPLHARFVERTGTATLLSLMSLDDVLVRVDMFVDEGRKLSHVDVWLDTIRWRLVL